MGNNNFTPINILWIEDNPIAKRIKCSEINAREGIKIFDSSLDNEFIPAIDLSGKDKSSYKYFNLKVLQHPEEIKEFISLCINTEDRIGPESLGSLDGVVPEIVVFDYKLYENITINQSGTAVFSVPYTKQTEVIRKYINPNYKILEKYKSILPDFNLFLDDPANTGYDDNDFMKRIGNVDKYTKEELDTIRNEMKNDEFGLYSGVEIVKHFRNHSCVGIPATANKADKKLLHLLSKYYEWLNEHDLSTSLNRKERGNKSWKIILRDGVIQLRERLFTLIKIQKITPSLIQLFEIIEDSNPTEKTFRFNSIYGKRELPLAGLFFDENDENKNEAIKKWCTVLLKIVTNNQIGEITEAKKKYLQLWESYNNHFLNRILLSDFSRRKPAALNRKYKNLYLQLRRDYVVSSTNEITKNLSSISMLFKEKKGKKNSKVNPLELRLLVLFLSTRLWIEHKKAFNICSNVLSNSSNMLLGKEDYYNLMNPVVNTNADSNHLLLLMHSDVEESVYTDTFDKWLSDHGNGIPRSNWNEFSWISAAEKIILNSFFFDDFLIVGKPDWLVNNFN